MYEDILSSLSSLLLQIFLSPLYQTSTLASAFRDLGNSGSLCSAALSTAAWDTWSMDVPAGGTGTGVPETSDLQHPLEWEARIMQEALRLKEMYGFFLVSVLR